MSLLQAIVLGAVQGLTEFLPISSSGHLIFIPQLFGWSDQGLSFDIMVHVGTLCAVIIYFRGRLWQMARSLLKQDPDFRRDRRLLMLLFLSIIPAGMVGLLAGDWIENNLRSVRIVVAGLIFWGIMLAFSDRYNAKLKKSGKNLISTTEIGWKRALFIACAQALALIPGTSRSGITMTAGLTAKLDKKSAAEFSFLMSVPIIFLAGVLNFFEIVGGHSQDVRYLPLAVGFVAAAVSGFMAIWILMKVLEKWNFLPFAFYRILIGSLIILTF